MRKSLAERGTREPADANAIAAFAHRAFEHVALAEFAADLLHVERLALVGDARIMGDGVTPTVS
jgi:hypothetical protein